MKDKLYELLGDMNETAAEIEHLHNILEVLQKYYEEKGTEDVLSVISVSKSYLGLIKVDLKNEILAMDKMCLELSK